MEQFTERIWGIESEYDSGRIAYIYNAIKETGLSKFNLVDIACGQGIIADGLQFLFPDSQVSQFDVFYYPEWNHLRVKPQCIDIEQFIASDQIYEFVLFVNSYRNYHGNQKKRFDQWIKTHAHYFITSGGEFPNKKIIGKDVKGHDLELYDFKTNKNIINQ